MQEATKGKRTEKEKRVEARRISREDWLAEGKKLFEDDPLKWRFVCPNCKHIQAMADFKELKELGIYKGSVQRAYFSCIGRVDSRIPDEDIGEIGDEKSPCDYTLGGFFRFVETIVIDGDGKENLVFEFDKSG